MTEVQPMKMAAAEALYETTDGASFSLFTIGTPDGSEETFSIRVPELLSFLATGTFDGRVEGINDLQAAYEAKYGPGDYTPEHPGHLLDVPVHDRHRHARRARCRVGAVAHPHGARPFKGRLAWWAADDRAAAWACSATRFGWIFTEMGRQPWIVFGLMPTAAGVSPGVSALEVLDLADRLHRSCTACSR